MTAATAATSAVWIKLVSVLLALLTAGFMAFASMVWDQISGMRDINFRIGQDVREVKVRIATLEAVLVTLNEQERAHEALPWHDVVGTSVQQLRREFDQLRRDAEALRHQTETVQRHCCGWPDGP